MSHHASNLLPGSTAIGGFWLQMLALLRRAGLRFFAVLTFVVSLSAVAAPGPTEYQVKAAFVFNFVKFTDWPAVAFTNARAPIVVGVLGENPFGRTLDDLVKGESVDLRPLVVKTFQTDDDFSACQVLFVSRSAKDCLPAVLAALKNKPVLTISDQDRFCAQGGMVNLVLSAGNTVQPEINPAAVRLTGLQISSKLLCLPTVRLVPTEP